MFSKNHSVTGVVYGVIIIIIIIIIIIKTFNEQPFHSQKAD